MAPVMVMTQVEPEGYDPKDPWKGWSDGKFMYQPTVPDGLIIQLIGNLLLFVGACVYCYRRHAGISSMLNPCIGLIGSLAGVVITLLTDTHYAYEWGLCVSVSTLLLLFCTMILAILILINIVETHRSFIYYLMYALNRGIVFMVILTLTSDFVSIGMWGQEKDISPDFMCFILFCWTLTFVCFSIVVDMFCRFRFPEHKWDLVVYAIATVYLHFSPMENLCQTNWHMYALIVIVYLLTRRLLQLGFFWLIECPEEEDRLYSVSGSNRD
ncbi:protein E14.1 [Elephant endotheliotropic herpesvirus 3B]|nr:protein E14.1 [Elephant endotheliotropic herpesvirus 3B]